MKKISKVLLLVIVSVAFCFGITGQQVEARDTSIIYGDGTITRAEWLHDLTVMFDMTVNGLKIYGMSVVEGSKGDFIFIGL